MLRREDAREGAEAQNPALKRAIDADVKRNANAAAGFVRNRLRDVPFPRTYVIGDRALELDCHTFRRTRMDAERMRKRGLGQLFDRRELLLEQRQVLDALDGK